MRRPQVFQRSSNWLTGFYYSFPVQLIVDLFRYHKLMLLLWLMLFLTVTQQFGTALGIPYLFLEPEYQGETGFLSFFFLGCGMGAFIASYFIASYIHDSYRFHFLALEKRPFYVFVLNSLPIPVLFFCTYAGGFLRFEATLNGGISPTSWLHLAATALGLLSVSGIINLYFRSTNKNVVQIFGEMVMEELKAGRVILEKARVGMALRNRVDSYFAAPGRLEHVDPSLPADFRKLVRILNQNHGNALFLELIFLGIIMSLGLLEHKPAFQLPAAASILLLFSIFLMFIAAFTFWIRKLGAVLLVLLAGLLFLAERSGLFYSRHQAIGMNYLTEPAPYNASSLAAMSSAAYYEQDKAATLAMLNQWKADWEVFHGKGSKPRAVIVCVSGGGSRSAYFTTRALQKTDSLSEGRLMEQTRLFTGASGGMVGVAFLRELYLQHRLGKPLNLHDPALVEPISKDLLNRLCFKIVSGLLLPAAQVQKGELAYSWDRGYSFDQQLCTNLNLFQDTRLADYALYEEQALIPQMILSPVVMLDGRRMFISASHVSYLSRDMLPDGTLEKGIVGMDFRRFFEKQGADSLMWVTALRMNASFPFIMPYVQLPTEPPIRMIDAGAADNHGIQTAIRYLHVFKEWFLENTERVLILQVRDSKDKSASVPAQGGSGGAFDPIGSTYSSWSQSKERVNTDYLAWAKTALQGRLDYALIEYAPEDQHTNRASLSWHLTRKEVNWLETALSWPKNKKTIQFVSDWLRGEAACADTLTPTP